MTVRNPIGQTSVDWQPGARAEAVLSAIIKEHLVTGEPVGSRTLSERCAGVSGWSPATIRNVMAELEEAGLVEQPHTSAGRVPTDKGYRFYVDHMVCGPRLSKADVAVIDRLLGQPRGGGDGGAGTTPGRLMGRVSQMLSQLSGNVGIVISPALAENRLQHIEFVSLTDDRVLVVLVFAHHVIQNKIIRLPEPFDHGELESAARYLNAEFAGKSLHAIRAEILRLMGEERALYDRLQRNAIVLCGRSLDAEEDAATGDVYVDGASNILVKSEFADVGRTRELFRTLEEKSRLINILNECLARDSIFGDVRVVIGRELTAPSMQACALISAPYRVGSGDLGGTLGVVGPMRIEYARMVAVVNYVAHLTERMLREESASA